MIRTVGELKEALEKFPDDMPITIADWEDEQHHIKHVNYPQEIWDESIHTDKTQVMIFTEEYIDIVTDEMGYDIAAVEELERQKNGGIIND